MLTRNSRGMTLVEMLIAMAILGIVLLITSSGIIQSLQVNRLADDAANTQSKLRRISEVVSQELRSAVMGSLTNVPYDSNSHGISFTLLSGDGGLPVTGNPHPQRTSVFTSDPAALKDLIGMPALIIEGTGRTRLVEEINDVAGLELVHGKCSVHEDYPVNTRLYSASVLGFQYNAEERTLYQTTVNKFGPQEVPFAYDLSRFEIAYEYDAGGGKTLMRSEAAPSGNPAFPAPVFTQDGATYQLARLRLVLASESDNDNAEREYISYIELSGMGNDTDPQQRTISNFIPCGDFVEAPVNPADPGPEEPEPGDDGDGNSNPDPEPEPQPEEPEPGDDGGNEPQCTRWFLWWCLRWG